MRNRYHLVEGFDLRVGKDTGHVVDFTNRYPRQNQLVLELTHRVLHKYLVERGVHLTIMQRTLVIAGKARIIGQGTCPHCRQKALPQHIGAYRQIKPAIFGLINAVRRDFGVVIASTLWHMPGRQIARCMV